MMGRTHARACERVWCGGCERMGGARRTGTGVQVTSGRKRQRASGRVGTLF